MSIRRAGNTSGLLRLCKCLTARSGGRICGRTPGNSNSDASSPTWPVRTPCNSDTPLTSAHHRFCSCSCWLECLPPISCCWRWRGSARANPKAPTLKIMPIWMGTNNHMDLWISFAHSCCFIHFIMLLGGSSAFWRDDNGSHSSAASRRK